MPDDPANSAQETIAHLDRCWPALSLSDVSIVELMAEKEGLASLTVAGSPLARFLEAMVPLGWAEPAAIGLDLAASRPDLAEQVAAAMRRYRLTGPGRKVAADLVAHIHRMLLRRAEGSDGAA